jgi:hypothetical protein
VNPDRRPREPAINRALRAWHLPPVIQNGTPEDPEMCRCEWCVKQEEQEKEEQR